MKLLQVISDLDPRSGGTIATIVGLSKAAAAAGDDVTVASTWSTGDDLRHVDELRDAGVKVELIGPAHSALRWTWGMGSKVRQLVGAADVVHIHAIWEEIQHQAAKACQHLNKPYVISPQGMLDSFCLHHHGALKKSAYLWLRLRSHLERATAIHFTAEAERIAASPLGLSTPSIIEPLAVDLKEFAQLPPRGTFRSKYPMIGDRTMLLFLSRVHPKKGLDLLIPAFAKAKKGDAVLVIAGPGSDEYMAEVKGWVDQHGVSDRVIFTGMLHGAERVAAFAEADLFVLPSYQENFGIAVVESLAAGTPVVISTGVNIHTDVAEARVGATVPVEVEPLTAALSRWLNDINLRREAGRRAIPFVRRRYDWNVVAGSWRRHYAELAGQPIEAGGWAPAAA